MSAVQIVVVVICSITACTLVALAVKVIKRKLAEAFAEWFGELIARMLLCIFTFGVVELEDFQKE